MDTHDRKLQQRIARRKAKVHRLIGDQETLLNALDDVTFLRQDEYLKAKSKVQNKLHRLKQELRVLDADKLPGNW